MDRKRIQAMVHGRVQGVAFREYTRREASRLGLSGWVGNLPDGTVQVMFEGSATQTEALLSWLAIGSPYSHVTRVEYNELPPEGETSPFFIRYLS
ncbi:MAG: acylphosphatase [Desulfobulbaceae bacterium]|jgi:acylphosphatase|nr:acylphosphatase [Desulfobulbaceae bacterium]